MDFNPEINKTKPKKRAGDTKNNKANKADCIFRVKYAVNCNTKTGM